MVGELEVHASIAMVMRDRLNATNPDYFLVTMDLARIEQGIGR
jgi:hypothetical protein